VLVFGPVVVMQDGIHQQDVIGNDLGAFFVASRNTANQCRHQTEFPPKQRVYRVHVASIGAGFFTTRHCSLCDYFNRSTKSKLTLIVKRTERSRL
jgi:hypothetical protein